MTSGWIKMHRKITDWEWYRDGPTMRLFLHLLLVANRRPQKWRGTVIGRGQVLTSRAKLAAETGLSERQIRTAFCHLKSTSEVTSKATNRNTIVTVCNYETYQSGEQDTDQQGDQPDDQQPTSNRPTIKQEGRERENNNIVHLEGPKARSPIPFQQIVDMYHNTCPNLPRVKLLTDSRKDAIRHRFNQFRDHPRGPLWPFEVVFNKTAESDFLYRQWGKCNLDWLMKQQNFLKVVEGNYDNRENNR